MVKSQKIIIVILPLIVWAITRYLLGFNGMYGQDSYEYFRYTGSLFNFFNGGPLPDVFFWSEGYPFFGALLTYVTGEADLSLQLVSVLSLSVSGLLLSELLDNVWEGESNRKGHYVILIFMLSPFVMRGGMLVMSDLLATCFVLAAYLALAKLHKAFTLKWLILFVAFAALSLLSRYACFFLLLVPSCYVLYKTFRENMAFHLLLAGLVAVICLLPHFVLRPDPADWRPEHMEFGWNLSNFFRSSFLTTEGYRAYKLPNLIYITYPVIHPGYLLYSVLLLPFFRGVDFRSSVVRLILLSTAFYLIFLGGMSYQNKRFFMICFPLILVVLYPAFDRLWSRFYRKWMTVLPVLGIIVLQLALLVLVSKPLLERNRLELKAAEIIRQSPGNTLYTFDIHQAMQAYEVKPVIFDLWVEQYIEFEHGSLLLFNEPAFVRQWSGFNPMKNYEVIRASYHLEELYDFGDGWQLFLIE